MMAREQVRRGADAYRANAPSSVYKSVYYQVAPYLQGGRKLLVKAAA